MVKLYVKYRCSKWSLVAFSSQGAYYTQPMYAAQPHVIHHTTVVQPNSMPSAIYPAQVQAQRSNGVAMGMVAGTTMAMSAGNTLANWSPCRQTQSLTLKHTDTDSKTKPFTPRPSLKLKYIYTKRKSLRPKHIHTYIHTHTETHNHPNAHTRLKFKHNSIGILISHL